MIACMQVLADEVKRQDVATLPAVLSSLPWLLTRFQAALKRQALAQAREAAHGFDHRGRTKGAAPASADFQFFAVLLQPILAVLETSWKVCGTSFQRQHTPIVRRQRCSNAGAGDLP